MPAFQNDSVPKYRENELPRTVKELRNYSYNLSEQMMFLFANLDEDNVPELNEIRNRFTDVDGNITNLKVDAQGLKLSIQNNENSIASLNLTVDGLKLQISDTKGNLSTLTQTVNSISTRVGDAEGNISTLTQTAKKIETQVADNKGNISNLQQTANGLAVQVSNNENNISSLRITANGLESNVADLNGKYSSLKQTVDGFDFTGFVTFNNLDTELQNYASNRDLRRGNTVIDGGCIQTGEIDVNYIYLHGEMEVYERGSLGGYIGYCRGYSDDGIGVMNSEGTGQCICTNGGAKLAYGGSKYFGVSRSNIFASEDIFVESDRRVKEDIRYNLDNYEQFYRSLKPCTYLLRKRESGRRHTGFIAQEIEEALKENGLSGSDFAAHGFDPDAKRYDGTNETGLWRVRYGELVALNTAMVQKLMERVDALEKELSLLKGELK